jgi:hypothetical protein
MPTAPPLQGVRLVMALLTSGHIAAGIDNGIGITPPRGWRSWNQFDTDITQVLIEAQCVPYSSLHSTHSTACMLANLCQVAATHG